MRGLLCADLQVGTQRAINLPEPSEASQKANGKTQKQK